MWFVMTQHDLADHDATEMWRGVLVEGHRDAPLFVPARKSPINKILRPFAYSELSIL